MTDEQKKRLLKFDKLYKNAKRQESPFCKVRGLPTYEGVAVDGRQTILPITKTYDGVISYQILGVHDTEKLLHWQCAPYAGGVIAIHNKEVHPLTPLATTFQVIFCESFKTGVVVHEATGKTVFCTLTEACFIKAAKSILDFYKEAITAIVYSEVNASDARIEKAQSFAMQLQLPCKTINHTLKPPSKPTSTSPRRKVRRISGPTRDWNKQ